jgi:hypothetical protein
MTETNRPETIEEFRAKALRDSAAATAAGLRRIANEVEQEAGKLDRIGSPGYATYGSVAESMLHAVMWGMANLRLERLARDATDADVARAKGE